MRFGKWFILLCLAVGLSACSQGDKQAASDEEPKVLTAKLAAPESAAKNEKAVIKATVLYGEEPVADADEVSLNAGRPGARKIAS